MRRLLEGELPVEPPPPAPRPVVAVEPEPVPVPPPLRKPAAPVLADARRAAASFGGDPDMNIGLPVQMPSMAESAQAFLRASHLEERVAEHMRLVDRRVSEHAPLKAARRRPPGIAVALSLLRDRESQRAAILAGVILGPPKALGE